MKMMLGKFKDNFSIYRGCTNVDLQFMVTSNDITISFEDTDNFLCKSFLMKSSVGFQIEKEFAKS